MERVIIGVDVGGTKCDMVLVDKSTGCVLNRVVCRRQDLPESLRMSENYGGIGRTKAMFDFTIQRLLAGRTPKEAFIITNSSVQSAVQYLTDSGIECPGSMLVMETQGAIWAEGYEKGIAIVSGTGVTGSAFFKDGSHFQFDAIGPLCGDWGGAYTIGREFLRRTFRVQNFSNATISETKAILDHYKATSGVESPNGSYFPIVSFLLTHTDRSLVSALAKVCDDCAQNGSALAAGTLKDAGADLAESVRLAAEHCNMAKMPGLPVIAAGSVLANSDLVFDSMRSHLSTTLPDAMLIRSKNPQVRGQILGALKKLNTPEQAAAKASAFLKSLEG